MSELKKSLRSIRNRLYETKIATESNLGVLRGKLAGKRPLKFLLLSDGLVNTSEQQLAPIHRFHSNLLADSSVAVYKTTLDRFLNGDAGNANSFDIFGIKLSFQLSEVQALDIVRKIKEKVIREDVKFVYFDGDDDLCVQWPSVLREMNLYVKKHVFSDLQDYSKKYVGKSNLTDYVSANSSYRFDTNPIPFSGQLTQQDIAKLHLGWNIGLDDKIFNLRKSLDSLGNLPVKDIDVTCRAFVPDTVWTFPLRNPLIDQLAKLPSTLSVVAARSRVSQDEYNQEMLRARICVSPFGYGELCWRDFEAVLCGCLLVKPSMNHVSTNPNIFIADQTYAPVDWDFENLAEVCLSYLNDPAKLSRTVANARQALASQTTSDSFCRLFDGLIDRLYSRASAS
jgi:hypothetical protein